MTRTPQRAVLHLTTAATLMLALLLAGLGARPAVAQTGGQLSGDVPAAGGFALVVWSGGTTAQLQAAAQARGCTLRSAFVSERGELVGYIFGAPDFVNATFAARFPGLMLPAGQALIIVCAGPPPSAPVRTSDIRDFAFEEVIAVDAGTTVEWTNRDSAPHDVVAVDNSFSSPLLRTDERYSRLFATPGRIQYYCTLHSNMSGFVEVR